MFNISNFRSEIGENGVLRNNRYLVTFVAPKYLRDGTRSRTSTDSITLRCETAQLPGMQFATIDGPPRLGYGPIESTPYGVTFEDLSLTFIVDKNSYVHKFFYDWVNCIVNYNNEGRVTPAGNRGPVQGMKTYEVGYRADFSTNINITVYDGIRNTQTKEEGPVLTATAYNAYPKALPSVDLTWQPTDEVVKLTIPFSYTDYNITHHKS